MDIQATGIPASGPGAGSYRTDFLYDALTTRKDASQFVIRSDLVIRGPIFSYSRGVLAQLVIRGELVIAFWELVIRAK